MKVRVLKLLFIWAIAVCLLALPLSSSLGKEKIIIGYFDLEPHTISINNKHSGAIIDLWEMHIAPQIGVEIEWQGPLPPVRMLASLKTGEINAIALLAKNDERAKTFDYPTEHFFVMEAGVSVLKNHPLKKINSVGDLAGLTLGFFKEGFIPPAMKSAGINWDLVTVIDWQKANFEKLLAKRIDGAFNPESMSLIYDAKKLGISNKIETLIIPQTGANLYSVFSKVDNGKWLRRYEEAVTALSTKEAPKLVDKYRIVMKTYVQ